MTSDVLYAIAAQQWIMVQTTITTTTTTSLPPLQAANNLLDYSRTGHRRRPPGVPETFPFRRTSSIEGETAREAIVAVAERFPSYGYRRIKAALRRRGIVVNHKKVIRIMREEGLGVFRIKLAQALGCPPGSRPLPEYPNLLLDLDVTGPYQAWAVDITMIKLELERVFLAAILDIYTRRCVGWALGRDISDRLLLKALRRALRARAGRDLTGLVHHSDQGLVYPFERYTDLLGRKGIKISHSRRGTPYDNAFIESFFATLKCEDVYLHGYSTYESALERLWTFIEDVYNTKRLHSALGYRSPLEFEEELASGT